MLDVLDFPQYLSEHNNKVEDVKVVCILNRQINMPEHLKDYGDNGSNIPSLVDWQLFPTTTGFEEYLQLQNLTSSSLEDFLLVLPSILCRAKEDHT